MQVTEKNENTDVPENSGKFEGTNGSKAVADQFSSYLTSEDEPWSLRLNIYANRLGKSQIGMAPWIETNLGNFDSYNSSQVNKDDTSIPLLFEKD